MATKWPLDPPERRGDIADAVHAAVPGALKVLGDQEAQGAKAVGHRDHLGPVSEASL